MSKQVIIVSKTHLDLGFTDFAKNIEEKYINEFIPNAIDIAKEVNTDKKRFVWTTGSWLINKALTKGTEEQKAKVLEAVKNGDIVAHGLPFTTHTELMSKEVMEYGLSIVDKIDKIRGKKTVSAKMTDVPGHTIALVPYLAKKGIKLLHIGVNGASTLPSVPPCFLWKNGEYEVVVIYSSQGYGGEFRCEYLDDILYIDHTHDNQGTAGISKTLSHFRAFEKKYPDYDVVAGSLDDYAEKIWAVKDKLPIVTSEIGDTWIHGVGTDWIKVGIMRELETLVSKWLTDGSLDKNSTEYDEVMDNLLCIAEHTWGRDVKGSFADFTHYLRQDFDKARKLDKVRETNPIKWLPRFILCQTYKNKSYSNIEASWKEQRDYAFKALNALGDEHRQEADKQIKDIVEVELPNIASNNLEINKCYKFNNNEIIFNEYGGIKSLVIDGVEVVKNNDKPAFTYRSYGKDDYKNFRKSYTRDLITNWIWSIPDFHRPLLFFDDKKFKKGIFNYTMINGEVVNSEDSIVINANLEIDDYCFTDLGAPKNIVVSYTLDNDGVTSEVRFKDKPANRLTESLSYRVYPNITNNDLAYYKIGNKINPYDVVEKGNRNLSSVEKVEYSVGDNICNITNKHASLVALGETNLLNFTTEFGDVYNDGLSFVLSNNMWGTNFPLWQEGDAYFRFRIGKN